MSDCIEDRLENLKALPEIEPRAELEPTVLAAMANAAAEPGRKPALRNLAIAASCVVALGMGALLAFRAPDYEEPIDTSVASSPTDEVFVELVEQSIRLEELYALLPPPRRVMRADTASTIVGLENRIVWIDEALYRVESQATAPQYREALMRDRVDVMNALVNVRYSQSRAFIF